MDYPVANKDLRDAMKTSDVPFWLVARQIGISENTLSRWLRVKVSPEQHKVISIAIKTAAKVKAEGNIGA